MTTTLNLLSTTSILSILSISTLFNPKASHGSSSSSSDSSSSDSSSNNNRQPLPRSSTITFGTYNTFQIFSSPSQSERSQLQIDELLNTYSDIDVLCLQELYLLTDKQSYIEPLSDLYPYTASEIDVWNKETPDKLTLPRIACNGDQNGAVASVNNECIKLCSDFYGINDNFEFIGCTIQLCLDQFVSFARSECGYCLFFMASLLPSFGFETSLENGLFVCNNIELNVNFELQDDTIILSKYPIINRYFFDLPDSNLLGTPLALNVVELDVSGHDEYGIEENVFVACTHFTSVSSNIPFFGIDPNIQDVIQLVEAQLRESIDIINGVGNDRNNGNDRGIITYNGFEPFVWMGDMNIGQLEPFGFSDVFKLFLDNGFIDMPDLRFNKRRNEYELECTWCFEVEEDDFNGLIELCDCEEFNNDLDHILVRETDKFNNIGINGERIFLDRFDISGTGLTGALPLSDHYGLVLELNIVESKKNKDSNFL